MSSKNDVYDGKKEEFKKYLAEGGVLDLLTQGLSALYTQQDKPMDAVNFIRSSIGAGTDDLVEQLKIENEALKLKIEELENNIKERDRLKEDENEAENRTSALKDKVEEHIEKGNGEPVPMETTEKGGTAERMSENELNKMDTDDESKQVKFEETNANLVSDNKEIEPTACITETDIQEMPTGIEGLAEALGEENKETEVTDNKEKDMQMGKEGLLDVMEEAINTDTKKEGETTETEIKEPSTGAEGLLNKMEEKNKETGDKSDENQIKEILTEGDGLVEIIDGKHTETKMEEGITENVMKETPAGAEGLVEDIKDENKDNNTAENMTQNENKEKPTETEGLEGKNNGSKVEDEVINEITGAEALVEALEAENKECKVNEEGTKHEAD